MRIRSAALAVVCACLLVPATTSATSQKPHHQRRCAGVHATVEQAGAAKVREAMLCIVNFERHARGLPKLRSDRRLQAAAQKHSADMARNEYFDHNDRNGHDPGERFNDEGYHWIAYGENIYLGPSDALDLMKGWMASEGHCQNILAPGYRDFGFGIATANGTTLSTQDFGTESGDEAASTDAGPQRSCPEKLRYSR